MKLRITHRSWTFLAILALGVAVDLWSGTQVDGYKLHVLHEPLPHPYPWGGVIWEMRALCVEALVLYAVLRPESYNRSWLRALCALLLSLGLLALFGMMLMHAPPHAVWHWLWLASISLGLLGLLAVSGIGALRSRTTRRPRA